MNAHTHTESHTLIHTDSLSHTHINVCVCLVSNRSLRPVFKEYCTSIYYFSYISLWTSVFFSRLNVCKCCPTIFWLCRHVDEWLEHLLSDHESRVWLMVDLSGMRLLKVGRHWKVPEKHNKLCDQNWVSGTL